MESGKIGAGPLRKTGAELAQGILFSSKNTETEAIFHSKEVNKGGFLASGGATMDGKNLNKEEEEIF